MEDLAILMKKWFFAGYKQAEEELGIQILPEQKADAPEVNIIRRGWPDPLKKAKKMHERMVKHDKAGIDNIKEKTKLTKDSPDVTVY